MDVAQFFDSEPTALGSQLSIYPYTSPYQPPAQDFLLRQHSAHHHPESLPDSENQPETLINLLVLE